ncbi:DegT/DnrJ/EryC1/StrS family aminotransferase [Nocardia carnea]|uniref:DegT/DnrJ/EryC1/StrS family aminotransferase n=1 Tax=Nocardia carnea TaxID=37328 RepID=UPI0024577F96|nr:DegT/DnrJ/EryC1/StrS family aminotransferase [Nocardia carnea]
MGGKPGCGADGRAARPAAPPPPGVYTAGPGIPPRRGPGPGGGFGRGGGGGCWAPRLVGARWAGRRPRRHTAHLFYLRLPTEDTRDAFIRHLADRGIVAPFHYVPLDSSAAGLKYGRTPIPCTRSARFAATIVRLPLWPMLTRGQLDRVLSAVTEFRC